MNNYYKILNIKSNFSSDKIKDIINFKLSMFNDLPFLTNNMKNEIKELYKAKYILCNKEKKEKYDKIIFKSNQKESNSMSICDRLFEIKY